MPPKPKKKSKEELEAERLAAEKAAKKAAAEAARKKAEAKERRRREKAEAEERRRREEEERRAREEEERRREEERLSALNGPLVDPEWAEIRRQDRVAALRANISSLLRGTRLALEHKDRLLDSLASQYDAADAQHAELHAQHLVRLERLRGEHLARMASQQKHFVGVEGEMARQRFAEAAARVREQGRRLVGRRGGEHAAWRAAQAAAEERREEERLARITERRENLLQAYHTARLSLLSQLQSVRAHALQLASDHDASTGAQRAECESMRARLEKLEGELAEAGEREARVRRACDAAGRRLEGITGERMGRPGTAGTAARVGSAGSDKTGRAGSAGSSGAGEGDLEEQHREGELQPLPASPRHNKSRFDEAEFADLKRQVAEVAARNIELRRALECRRPSR
ncbi:hypothetical protein DFJ74DRAFT_711024 [Hyaloraphidium curvatum]|nr:hypothetical protein DFJ74DRAFT_711024 [Hyaloraphidium curvatum]